MARPLFVLGMQRNGTTILSRIIQAAPGVARGYHPCPRWDVPLQAELGADLPEKRGPWLAGLRLYMERAKEPWGLAKLSLTCSAESFAWPLLAKRFPRAAFVGIVRDPIDALASWRTLPYLAAYGAQERMKAEAYYEWVAAQRDLLESFFAQRPDERFLVAYEDLVLAPRPTLAPLWRLLQVPEPKGWERWMRRPKHWRCRAAPPCSVPARA